MIHYYIKTIIFLSWIFICCGHSNKEENNSKEAISAITYIPQIEYDSTYSYDFKSPSNTFILEKKLVEISGLAFDSSSNYFLSNNDEKGHIYKLDVNTFKIKEDKKFGKRGDYEAIEKVGDDIITCKSSGKLFFYNEITTKTISYDTPLKSQNDVEGLCYDPRINSLILACKGQPINAEKGRKNQKSVYLFDLEKKELNQDPFFSIYDEDLAAIVNRKFQNESKSKIRKWVKRAKEFSPSGIAINPESGDYYLISAKGSLLLILSEEKKLKNIIFLNSKTNPQPEGICFDKESNLYISTEGQGLRGKIFKFKYI
ncbi:MAG: hypothetical protein HKO66_06385 [Saprospiraceae bacterium]|nr:hypothetical protein [Saprospiraceae bacterium]